FVPSMLSMFLEYLKGSAQVKKLSSLKQVFASGEALSPVQVEQFYELLNKENGIILTNLYGPTEATVDVSYFNCSPGKKYERIPIGKPIDNINLYILDKNLHHQPAGVVGELHIAGIGLARGYLNRPGLTMEKFIHKSFRKSAGDCLYKTGDLARRLDDGNIEFLGRIDHQVKIRGFRIEVEEIENRLVNHIYIKEAVVLANTDESGDKYLCAYIVPAQELTAAELKEYLTAHLPNYMIPPYFTFLEQIPLTANGKIDRDVLPKPGLIISEGYTAPIDEIEIKLVAIWAEVLHIDKDKISTHDNFFNMGGHSLKAITLTSLIHKEFNVKIPQAEVFIRPTVKGLAQYIRQAVRTGYESIEPVEKKEYYVLSPSQKRLYILQQMSPLGTAYNIPQMIPLPAEFNVEKLVPAFLRLIRRHESLRTSFQTVNDQPVQKVHAPGEVDFKLEYYDDSSLNRAMGRFVRPFDLSKPLLPRAGLLKLNGKEEQPPVLLVDMHHIISDGVSRDVLAREFLLFYQAGTAEILNDTLPPLRIQYKDFAQWQNSPAQIESTKQQEAYWLRIFEGKIPVLNLPWDFPRPEMPSFAGDAIGFTVDKQLLRAAGIIASQQGVTMYMLLLTMFNILLARLCGQEDIVIGTASAGRGHADLEGIIGMFVNTLAIRNYPLHNKRFNDFLQDIKQRTLAAFENQDYPFEDLVDHVVPNRNIDRNPLFDVMFNYLELTENRKDEPPGTAYEYGVNASKFDMTFAIAKTGADDFHFNIRYSTQLFKKETIRDVIQAFKEVVSGIVANPSGKISEIKMATPLKVDNDTIWGDSCDDLENE
ncbi:MAG TPA: condensation domain-containing protein, partial [Candidatus Deferrimicrobium sp.]|nr:condensation domain-containing protein [Candidatus Deferrimicrobium sp.]